MLMFTLAIFCLTTSSLPWVMDLTFQVSMQYCSLQNQSLIHCETYSQLGIVSALAHPLHSFWSCFSALLQQHIGHLPTWGVHLFILFMGHSSQEWWSGLPFPSPVDHVLSELSTMTHLSWVVSFIAWLIVSLRYTKLWSVWLVFCDCDFVSVCPLMDEDKRVVQASWKRRDWL